jgi:hypothetical protein
MGLTLEGVGFWDMCINKVFAPQAVMCVHSLGFDDPEKVSYCLSFRFVASLDLFHFDLC